MKIKVIDAVGHESEITHPGNAQGHVYPGRKATINEERKDNFTQRGFWGQAPGPCGYYDAWYQIEGRLYFPIGDEHNHR